MFDCKVTGTPFPVTVISWKKDDDPVDVCISDEKMSGGGVLTRKPRLNGPTKSAT